MIARLYIQGPVVFFIVWAALVLVVPLSTAQASRHAPMLTQRDWEGLNQAHQTSAYDLRSSAEKTGKRAMLNLFAGTSVLALLTLGMLGVAVYRARLHEPKLNSHTQARELQALRNPTRPLPASSMIYTSDLYDVASRGRDGQTIRYQRTRDWHYDKEVTHSMPQPKARERAQARAKSPNKIPSRQASRKPPMPMPREVQEKVTSRR